MSKQPFTASALRGAVDLSALSRPPGPPGGGSGVAGASAAPDSVPAAASGDALVVTGTDATFQAVVNTSIRVPVVVVLWSARLPQSADFVDVMTTVARSFEGRFQLVSVNVDDNPGLLRAFQLQQVPMTLGLVQGQPVPLFVGVQTEAEVKPWIDELLAVAVQHGVTGRVATSTPEGAAAGTPATPGAPDAPDAVGAPAAEPGLPPLHQQAYDAIDAGDLAGAVTAFEQALKENPADGEAALGLAQVRLMQRTAGLDPRGVRATAEANPQDVAAQTLAADVDLIGGDVDAAFSRLVDAVRATSGDDRERVREHLLELFEIVGPSDDRVGKARRALMTALF